MTLTNKQLTDESKEENSKHEKYVPSQSLLTRLIEGVFAIVNRFVRWDKLPPWLGILSLSEIRTKLRKHNLYDTQTAASRASSPLPLRCPVHFLTNRSPDGSYNDLNDPTMGQADRRFGRNMPLDSVQRPSDRTILTPNPRLVARELMTRERFQPAKTLNVLAAAWIQFMIHDWFAHITTKDEPYFEIEIDQNDHDWPQEHRPMKVRRTAVDPTAVGDSDQHPTPYINKETPWWDGSQIYGRNEELQHKVRSHVDGKLTIDEQTGLLPKVEVNSEDGTDGVEVVPVNENWWLGLSLLHTLFTLEHNAICDRLKQEYPNWSDEQLFNKARLINTALIAKIHTVEWTPAILGNPTLEIAMNANWWGLAGEHFKKAFGRISDSEAISGIPGSDTNHFGVPYSLTEEFVSVYRMHPLLPDDFFFRSVETDQLVGETKLDGVVGAKARALMEQIETSDLFYSFGIANPGAVTLKNYPNFLRKNLRRDGRLIDLAAVEILRDRERGVPRYNEFRKLLRLEPIKTFRELTADPKLAQKIESVYQGKIDDVDLMVGMFGETPPPGFGFSDTAFRIFVLMASRRLNSDRFFTTHYTPQVYTQTGLDWVANNTMISVLLRHYPKLEPALRLSKNAFAPWLPVSTSNPTTSSKKPSVFDRIKSLFNPLRINIPFLLDIIIVSDPEQIRKIETSGDVDRFHAYDTASLPWWVKFYFRATKFHDDERDLWFCPFEPTSNPSYQPRRAYLEEKVATGYTQEDVQSIAELLRTNASDEVLAHEMVQVVNHRFFGKEIPLAITKAAKCPLQSLGEALLPWKYIRGVQARREIMNYCEQNLSKDVHILDVGHNIGEVVQASVGALRRLKDNLDKPVEEIFTTHAPTPQVPRIAVKSSNLDGLLFVPTTPGKTVVIFKVGEAAAETHDISFTFGTGSPERACVFQDFFLAFMNDLQKELKQV
ncbi:peroxidase family protein [Iningainema tapete]|uniref:Heme peroxidase n=1 Tax=Iningainema tapete BLCC-T55 TaxID=2748662 RepID=A0A8J6XL69_9CYAN|nr:peroxidase family protein [Iningainema tapete]MBD2774776.1 hypothetical protein [Iningainema tapete BLCC-T55]